MTTEVSIPTSGGIHHVFITVKDLRRSRPFYAQLMPRLGYPGVWEFDGGGEPFQNWWTLGLQFGLSDKASLRLFWAMSDSDADGVGAFTFLGQERARGGLIGTQLSVKF